MAYTRRPAWLTITAGLVALIAVALATGGGLARAQEVMHSFTAVYEIQSDGTILVTEEIAWDFGTEPHHGIFRDLVDHRGCLQTEYLPGSTPEKPLYRCRAGYSRQWPITVSKVEVSTGGGAFNSVPYDVSEVGDGLRLKIGDADKLVTGAWRYRLQYRLEHALDSYDGHDEFYWNALGTWTVPVEKVTVDVRGMPASSTAQCFQGASSTQPCRMDATADRIRFSATRTLFQGEELTIVAGWTAGPIHVDPPILTDDPSIDDYFALDTPEFGGMAAVGVLSIAGLVFLWWRHGRDRRYKTLYYLTNDPAEHTAPLFASKNIVVEYLPPDDLRPAQMGVLLDERADPLDVTATIVDLAVRGYLHITEIPKEGWFGSADWTLTKLKDADNTLLPYERTVLGGLFDSQSERKLSELKNKFYDDLSSAQGQLYGDAMERKWFARRPGTAKSLWLFAGIAVVAAGVGLSVASGWFLGRALIATPVIPAGLMLVLLSRTMSRRTAAGSEALRRVLGFRLYVATAETRQQEFNEQKNIFARYLPYAIVFGCVDKWAKAFEGMAGAAEASTLSWYTGAAAFNAMVFSSSLQSFSSSISSTIASAPSSGGSGFSGGFSGGGGGGGGGGSW